MAYQREVRLGLVLYGGVSLAVYENGVAQELHRAVRGEGLYGLLCELVDSDIVVDIISGTSAGGVNGIMLAYALANGRSFSSSAELWRNQGDIQALLRRQNDPAETSILDSSYYQTKLESCFTESLSPDRTAPDIEELDLFITGTDANGDIYTVYDDQGHPIDVKNHRALFRLEYRNGRKNDLDKATPADLARLARITSCFPAAFEPVTIDKRDKVFFDWGKLRNSAVFLDGGILNNKPFTSTIDAIFRRTATRDVERYLIYVEPDPEVFADPSPDSTPLSPSVVRAAVSSLTSIPRYQSIASDLEAIQAHNERAQRIAEMLDAMPPAPDAGPGCLDQCRPVEGEIDQKDSAYYAARLIQLRDTAVEGILNDHNGRAYISSLNDRRSGRILVESFGHWEGDPQTTLTDYDVFFRMRRTAHLSHALMRRTKLGTPAPASVWELINHYFKVYEMTEWVLLKWLDEWDFDWRGLGAAHPDLDLKSQHDRQPILKRISTEIWGKVQERLQLLLHSDVQVPHECTQQARTLYYQQLTAQLKSPNGAPALQNENLLCKIDDAFKSALKGLTDDSANTLRNEFCRFLDVDRQLFPVQIGSGFESIDTVRVVRFSPKDAKRGLSKGEPSEKVCGTVLGAFGGFFKKSWRANDIMIGRFDAACLLTECLLTKERLAALRPGRSITLAQLKNWFPSIDSSSAADLLGTINNYLRDPSIATPESWDNLINVVVSAAHHEIEREEWPRVVSCAIQQHHAWGQYLPDPSRPFDKENRRLRPGTARPDQVLVDMAAGAIAAGKIPQFTPGSVAGGNFLEEIPETILQELGSLGLLRTLRGIMPALSDDRRKRLEGSRIYRVLFGRVVPVYYRWARMRRTQPTSVVVLNTIIPTACVTILLLALGLKLLGADLTWKLWGIVLAVPILAFLVWSSSFLRETSDE